MAPKRNREELEKAYDKALDTTVEAKRALNKAIESSKKNDAADPLERAKKATEKLKEFKLDKSDAESVAQHAKLKQAVDEANNAAILEGLPSQKSDAETKAQYAKLKQAADEANKNFLEKMGPLKRIQGYDNIVSGFADIAEFCIALNKKLNADIRALEAAPESNLSKASTQVVRGLSKGAGKLASAAGEGTWGVVEGLGIVFDKQFKHNLSGIRTSEIDLSAEMLSENPQDMVTVKDGKLKFDNFAVKYEDAVSKSEQEGLKALDNLFPVSIDLLLKKNGWEQSDDRVYTKNGKELDQPSFNKLADRSLATHLANVMKGGLEPEPDPDLNTDDTPSPFHP